MQHRGYETSATARPSGVEAEYCATTNTAFLVLSQTIGEYDSHWMPTQRNMLPEALKLRTAGTLQIKHLL